MSQTKLRTADPASGPENKAVIKFVEKKQAASDQPSVSSNTNPLPINEENELGPAKKPRRTKRSQSTPAEPIVYKPLSTRIRSDLKRKLKRLSYDREDAGHDVRHVQDFIEEALTQWLDRQADAVD